MDRESSRGIGMRLLAPRLNNRNLIFLAPLSSSLGQGRCWKITPGKSTAVRRSCVPPPLYRHWLQTITHTHTHTHTHKDMHSPPPPPDPSPPSLWTASLTSGSVTSTGIVAAGPDGCLLELDYFPCGIVMCLWCMCFCAEVFFLFSHCTPQGA